MKDHEIAEMATLRARIEAQGETLRLMLGLKDEQIRGLKEMVEILHSRISDLLTRNMNMVGAAFQDQADSRNAWKGQGAGLPILSEPPIPGTLGADEAMLDRVLSGDGD